MPTPDDFSTYVADLLSGTYDSVDRTSLRGYYPMGETSGGLLTWWNQLHPGTPLTAGALRMSVSRPPCSITMSGCRALVCRQLPRQFMPTPTAIT